MSTEKQGFQEPPPSYSAGSQYPQNTSPYPQNTSYPPAAGQPQHGQQQYGQQQYGQPQYGQQYVHTQAVVVTQPGGPGVVMAQARPPDYMVPSVLACLCCFWPTGLCAIYYASRANTFSRDGDMIEAQRMANNARNLMITSVIIGICWIVLVIVLRVVVYSTTSNRYGY